MKNARKYDVFISHKTAEDGVIANRLVSCLESRGLKCWIAPRDIPASQNYASAIVDGIERSSVFLMLFSRYANESKDIVREVQQASRFKLPILTVRLDDTDFSPALSYFLSLPQGIGPFRRNETVFDGVFTQVKALLDGTPTPSPRTPTDPKPRRMPMPLWGAALALAIAAIAAVTWHRTPAPRTYPSTRAEVQTVNEVLRVVGNLSTAYQCAAQARIDFVNDAINSVDSPTGVEADVSLLRKRLNDALGILANTRPSEESIGKLTDTPLDAAVYRALLEASRMEIEEDLKTLPKTIPFYLRKDNSISLKHRKACLQQAAKRMELNSQFFALGVVELLQPVSPEALKEFRRLAATFTAIPRLAAAWPPDKDSLEIEQEAVLQRIQAIETERSAIVGNLNMDYSGERQKLEETLRQAGATPEEIANILGNIEDGAARKTEEAWADKTPN